MAINEEPRHHGLDTSTHAPFHEPMHGGEAPPADPEAHGVEPVPGLPAEVLSPAEERFETWRRTGSLFLGPALFFLLLIFPPGGLEPAAAGLAAVMAWVLIWWMGEAVPLPVTGLLGPSLCILIGLGTPREILAGFADPIIFVFIGSFMLARAMTVHGLDRRLALGLLSVPGLAASPARLVVGFGLVAGFVSMWLSNTAVTAMLLPIGLGLLAELGRMALQSGDAAAARALPRVTVALLLMTAFGASVGGLATPIGTPPNLIGIGQLRKELGLAMTFTDWMGFALPITLVLMAVLAGVLLVIERPGNTRLPGLAGLLAARRAQMGPLSPGERNALIAFSAAVLLWIGPSLLGLILGSESDFARTLQQRIPEATAAIVAATLLFVLPIDWGRREFTLTWDQAAKIDWGTIFIFGSGICLGGLAFSTGLARAFADSLLALTGVTSLIGITALVTAMAILLSELTSNTAAATMVVPVSIALAQAAGVDPTAPALGACLGSSFGFMLPVSTAPNALVYGTGRVPLWRMFRAGVVFDVLGWVVITTGVVLLAGK